MKRNRNGFMIDSEVYESLCIIKEAAKISWTKYMTVLMMYQQMINHLHKKGEIDIEELKKEMAAEEEQEKREKEIKEQLGVKGQYKIGDIIE